MTTGWCARVNLLVPDSWAALEPWIDVGVLGAFEVHAADAIVRLGTPAGEAPPSSAVVLGAALALWAPLRGHACIDLADAPAIVAASAARRGDADADDDTDDTAAPDVGALAWPEPARWLEALVASPLVRVVARHDPMPTPGPRPLVLHGSRLYTQRQWIDECTVAAALTARIGERTAAPAVLQGSGDRQLAAVDAASGRALTVVVGGPGTGKTHTIARLLARVLTDEPDARIGLAAPTGKAAARLAASVHAAAGSGTWSHDVAAALGRVEAVTLHRLLGWRPGSRTRFRHDAAHPLPVDVVVIDETSMVPLPMMARLLEAMPAAARLVLVGDPDQLESVEVGAVLGDIVRSTAMRPAVVRLERQYRTAAGSPIGELAGLVRQGRADDVLDLLHAGADGLTYVGFAAGPAAVREAVLADLVGGARRRHERRRLSGVGPRRGPTRAVRPPARAVRRRRVESHGARLGAGPARPPGGGRRGARHPQRRPHRYQQR